MLREKCWQWVQWRCWTAIQCQETQRDNNQKGSGLFFFFFLLGEPQGFTCSQQCLVTLLVFLVALEDALTFLPPAAAVTEAAANKML